LFSLKPKSEKNKEKVGKVKRSLVIFGIVFLLVISIAYAGVLNYYGKIIGTANVLPPTFYATSNSISSNLYTLQINQKPGSEGTITVTDGNSVYFMTEPLGINSFYKGKWHFYIKGKSNSGGSTKLSLEFYVPDGANYWVQKTKICEPIILSIETDAKVYDIVNENCYQVSLSPSDRFIWKITGPVDISITTNGDTRIEVSKA
jgi:hypothetical protein